MSLLLSQLSQKTRMVLFKAPLRPSCQKRSRAKGACVCAAMKILLLICTFGRCVSQMSGRIKGSVMSFAKVESCFPILPQRDKAAAKSTGESAASVLCFCAWSQRGSVASALEWRAQRSLLPAAPAALPVSTGLSRRAATDGAFCVPPKQTPRWGLIPVVPITCVQW